MGDQHFDYIFCFAINAKNNFQFNKIKQIIFYLKVIG